MGLNCRYLSIAGVDGIENLEIYKTYIEVGHISGIGK